jgi:hypothetical protein
MMQAYTFVLDPLTITIIFIILCAAVAAFVSSRRRDMCLKDFQGDMATLEETQGKVVWGRLRVESTGLEFVYAEAHPDTQGHTEKSYIVYKQEFANIQVIIRFLDQLSEKGSLRRREELKRTYHPRLLRRLKRRILNLFKTLRDSFVDVINLFIARARTSAGVGAVLAGQDQYVSRMKEQLVGSVGTAYEPLLERHIGHTVVLEMIKGDKVIEYPGLLKDYTADFIELLDVSYATKADEQPRKADIIVPRNYGLVRHLAE